MCSGSSKWLAVISHFRQYQHVFSLYHSLPIATYEIIWYAAVVFNLERTKNRRQSHDSSRGDGVSGPWSCGFYSSLEHQLSIVSKLEFKKSCHTDYQTATSFAIQSSFVSLSLPWRTSQVNAWLCQCTIYLMTYTQSQLTWTRSAKECMRNGSRYSIDMAEAWYLKRMGETPKKSPDVTQHGASRVTHTWLEFERFHDGKWTRGGRMDSEKANEDFAEGLEGRRESNAILRNYEFNFTRTNNQNPQYRQCRASAQIRSYA